MIRAQAKELNEKEQMAVVNQIKQVLGNDYEYRRVELVGPQVGDELKKAGIIASVIAVLAISAYIWFRFEWQFALGAMIGLLHDIITTVGLLSFFGFDFSLTTVAAVLTLSLIHISSLMVRLKPLIISLSQTRAHKSSISSNGVVIIFCYPFRRCV